MVEAKVIGNNIRRSRKQKGLTMEQLAELVDITPNFLGKLERGDSLASIQALDSLSVALDISLDNLVHNYDYNNTEYQYIKSLIEINDLTKENRERFIDFLNTNIKYFK